MTKNKRKNVAVIGGGTGTSVVLEGLKKYPVNLSAIITTADDGSSSGRLREEFDMIPPGDIRQCLVALASSDFQYLNERFQRGSVAGHTLGNLLITLFYDKHRNFQQAIDELLRITGANGSLIPMTLMPVTLVAKLNDGRELVGESVITPSREISTKLEKLYLRPRRIRANPRAVSAIKNADVIVVGPGNLFCSIMPNLLLEEIKDALIASRAKKIYVSNLFTQPGHTDSFYLEDFIRIISKYIGADIFTHIIYNKKKIGKDVLGKYRNSIISSPLNIGNNFAKDERLVARSMASSSARVIKHDPISNIRNPFLHDPGKLAKAIMSVWK